MTGISGIGTIGVPVRDQERALAFYLGPLGFEMRRDAPYAGGQRWLEVAPPGGATTLALVPPRDGGPVGVDTGIRLTTRDADTDHAALRAAGVEVDAEVMRWPGVPPMFSLRDPDGNQLYVVQGDPMAP
jgi:catechol 2,3-dioxygenase-like lactoylglutathione lyase family enzyme